MNPDGPPQLRRAHEMHPLGQVTPEIINRIVRMINSLGEVINAQSAILFDILQELNKED